MDDELRLGRYDASDQAAVFDFLAEVHPPPVAERMIDQWTWKYHANPSQVGQPYILLMRDGERIVGMMGAIPYRVSIQGEERMATHSCDLVVRPDYRRRAVAQRIIAQYTVDNPMGFA